MSKIKPKEEKIEITEAPKEAIFAAEGELVCDVYETSSDFVITSAIAGVQIKDIDISVEKDMLIVKGERKNPCPHSETKYFYQECYWGPFSKKIVLPENLDTENASAQMDKGLLTIMIPKTEKPTNAKLGIKQA